MTAPAKRGRPSIPDAERLTEKRAFRLTKSEAEAAHRRAATLRLDLSTWVRSLVVQALRGPKP